MAAEWRMSEDAARQVRLLEWIAERAVDGIIPAVAPFYDDDESRHDQARNDVNVIEARTWVQQASGMGGLQGLAASPTPFGLQILDMYRVFRADKGLRKRAGRTALVGWLYQQDAVETASQAVSWREIFGDGWSLFYGEAFTVEELDRAVAWLVRHELVGNGGGLTDQFDGPIRCYLTDHGVRCAERFGSDATDYVDETEKPAASSVTNVTGHHVQVAMGERAQQVMNVGTDAEQIVMALRGIVELMRVVGIDGDSELEELRDAAVDDVTAEKPTGEPARRFVSKVRGMLGASANTASTVAISAATNGVIQQVEHLVRAVT